MKSRKRINTTLELLTKDYPITARLGKLHVQLLNIQSAVVRLHNKSAKELVSLSPSGKLSVEINSKALVIDISNQSVIKAVAGQEEKVKSCYAERYALLEKAFKERAATKHYYRDIAVIIKNTPRGVEVIELKLSKGNEVKTTMGDLKTVAPALRKYIYCKLQEKGLKNKLNGLHGRAIKELASLKNITINTEIQSREVNIAAFSTHVLKLKKKAIDWNLRLTSCDKTQNERLDNVIKLGYANKVIQSALRIFSAK